MTPAKARYFFSVASLSTGSALLIYFIAGISLGLGILAALIIVGFSSFFMWQQLSKEGRREIIHRVRSGLLSGVLATLCYDISRFILVSLGSFSIWPFDTFRLFGLLIIGSNLSPAVTTFIGTLYHLANGLSFAVAFTLVFGYRGWLTGVAWAMGLEVLMVSFYPGWLELRALDEFLSVSILGHLVYGSVLGWSSRKLLMQDGKLVG